MSAVDVNKKSFWKRNANKVPGRWLKNCDCTRNTIACGLNRTRKGSQFRVLDQSVPVHKRILYFITAVFVQYMVHSTLH